MHSTVIASGNLATARRTITGVLAQFSLLQIDDDTALAIITDAGLPPRGLQEPDFPVSLQQELFISTAVARLTAKTRSPVRALFGLLPLLGIEHMGVLGMAMRHAATAVEALEICLTYPQLTWGHSRLIVRKQADSSQFSFSMERPQVRDASEADIDLLIEHCLVLDLLSTLRNIEDIADTQTPPLYITFPFAQPPDWHEIENNLTCSVYFQREEACLAYPMAMNDGPLPRANPLIYRSFVSIADKLAAMLAEDISVRERVSRWLWAYTPPLKRGEIASQLAMSERSLTRQLSKEGTSYAQLLAKVQEERGKNFLRNRSLSVTEIGYRLGYSEPAAFTRAFTQWTGLSPLKWRKQLA